MLGAAVSMATGLEKRCGEDVNVDCDGTPARKDQEGLDEGCVERLIVELMSPTPPSGNGREDAGMDGADTADTEGLDEGFAEASMGEHRTPLGGPMLL